jgi:hypothetical protein
MFLAIITHLIGQLSFVANWHLCPNGSEADSGSDFQMEPFQPQVTGSRLDTELGIQSEISSFSLLHCRNQDKSFLKYFFKSALTLVEKQKPSTGGAGPKARGTTSPPKTMTPGLPDPWSGVWAQHRSTTILKSYTTPHLSPTLYKACDITTARQSGRTSNPPPLLPHRWFLSGRPQTPWGSGFEVYPYQ